MNETAQQATELADLIIPLVGGLSVLFTLVVNWLRRRINEGVAENIDLKARLTTVESKNSAAEKQITSLMRDVMERDGKLQEQENRHIREIMDLEQKFDIKLTESNGRIGIMEGAVKVLETANGVLQESLEQTSRENEDLRGQKDEMSKNLEDYRAEQEEKMQARGAKIEQLELENKLLRGEYDELKKAYTALEQQVKELAQSTNGKATSEQPVVDATESVKTTVKEQ